MVDYGCIRLSIAATLHYSSAEERLQMMMSMLQRVHEAKLELDALDRISLRSRRFPHLPVLHPVSSDTRFSVGEFPAVRRRWCALAHGSRPGIRKAEALSREDIWLHPGHAQLVGLLSIRLPDLF